MLQSLRTFRALQNRNYRLYFAGQVFSLMGTWIQRTAVYWLVYSETHSAFMLSLTIFATQFPSFLFALFGGAIADRHDPYKVMLITQWISMVQAVMLAGVVMFTDYTVVEILLLSFILGIINAFDLPARQSLVHFMVDNPQHLGNAIALNSSMVNIARLVGPAVAGILLDRYGAASCFSLNALSFVAVLSSLMALRLNSKPPEKTSIAMLDSLKQGFGYVRKTPAIGSLILLLMLLSFFVLPSLSLLPVLTKEVFDGRAETFGYLMSFVGIGALISTLLIASLSHNSPYRKILFIALILVSIGLIALSQTSILWLAFVFSALVGFGMMINMTVTNTLLQTTSVPEMRGRVISYFAMAFFGLQPLGTLVIGAIVHILGVQTTLMLEGICAFLILALFSSRLLSSTKNTNRFTS